MWSRATRRILGHVTSVRNWLSGRRQCAPLRGWTRARVRNRITSSPGKVGGADTYIRTWLQMLPGQFRMFKSIEAIRALNLI